MVSRTAKSKVHKAKNKQAAERIAKQLGGAYILKLTPNERKVFGARYLVGKNKKTRRKF